MKSRQPNPLAWIRDHILNRLTKPERPTRSRVITDYGQSGVWVDADSALKNATVWACQQYLTRAVAQLPWHVMQRDDKGNASIVGNQVDRLLNSRPNPEMGAFSFRQTILGHALMRGNGYAEIERDARGVPFALWPIHPDRVTPIRNGAGELVYDVWNSSGGAVRLGAMDMFHIRGFGDGAVGYDVIAYAAESIGWAQATQVFGSTIFSQGMNPNGVVTASAGLSPEGLEELRKDLDRLYNGPRGRKTMILDASMKFEPVTTNAEQSQFVETRQHQIEEICRWFGVPPHKVMHLVRSTFSNIEHQSIEVVVDSVTPWVRAFEQEADYKLFGAANRQGFYTKIMLQGLMRGDNASRVAFYQGMSQLGMTLNQILALEDLNGVGPDGDVPFVTNNLQTLRRAIEGPPAPQLPAPDTTENGDDVRPNGEEDGPRVQH